jgi:hypothetical protein
MPSDNKIQPLRSAETGLMFCSGKECPFFLDEDGWEVKITSCTRSGSVEIQEPGGVCAWFYVEKVGDA